jgi:hypothetical protein
MVLLVQQRCKPPFKDHKMIAAIAYLSTSYLAPIRYFGILSSYDRIYIETAEHYVKQSYRNRCHIAGANGLLSLTVPVEKPGAVKYFTRDILVSGHGNWRHTHWNALVSAYRMTPFFDYYEDDFRPFYEEHKYKYLIDYNESLQSMICGLTGINPEVHHTTAYLPDVTNDFRNTFSPKKKEDSQTIHFPPYYQLFKDKNGFIPDLSITDLLFNTGPETLLYLKKNFSFAGAGL